MERLRHAIDQTQVLRRRIEGARTRTPILDASLEVIERDSQVGGGILAGALAYRLFLFFLPLGFFLIAVLGLVASWTGTKPVRVSKDIGIVNLVTNEVAETAQKGSGFWVALVSIVVLAYVTIVLHRAVAVVHALAWENSAVPAKAGRSRKIFALGLVAQLVALGVLGGFRPESALAYTLSLAGLGLVLAAIWLGMSLRLPHAGAPWTALIPGAILYGVGLLCRPRVRQVPARPAPRAAQEQLRHARHRFGDPAQPLPDRPPRGRLGGDQRDARGPPRARGARSSPRWAPMSDSPSAAARVRLSLFSSKPGGQRFRRATDVILLVPALIALAILVAAYPPGPFERAVAAALNALPSWIDPVWGFVFDLFWLWAILLVVVVLVARRVSAVVQALVAAALAFAVALVCRATRERRLAERRRRARGELQRARFPRRPGRARRLGDPDDQPVPDQARAARQPARARPRVQPAGSSSTTHRRAATSRR